MFHFFVEDLAKEINARTHLRDAFDFSKISNGHLSNLGRGIADLYAGEVGYFKDETKGNLIVEFVGLRPMMYSFTECDASEPIPGLNYPMDIRHKAVTKGVARSQIKRFKHEDYLRMFNGGALTNVVNRRRTPPGALIYLYLNMHDHIFDYLFSGIHYGAGNTWTLPVR